SLIVAGGMELLMIAQVRAQPHHGMRQARSYTNLCEKEREARGPLLAIALILIFLCGCRVPALDRDDFGQGRLGQLATLDDFGGGDHRHFTFLLGVLRYEGLEAAVLERVHLGGRRVVGDDLDLAERAGLSQTRQSSDRALVVGREYRGELWVRRQRRGDDLSRLLRIVALILRAEVCNARIFLQFLFEARRAGVLRG